MSAGSAPGAAEARLTSGSTIAVRTCVGCRGRAEKSELLRVVAADRGAGLEVVPDPAGRAPGRGAHLHPTAECLGLALRRRAFPRALRTRVPGGLGTTAVVEHVALQHDMPDQHDQHDQHDQQH